MANNLIISAVVRLVDQVSAPLRGVTKGIDNLGKELNKSGASLVRWGVGLTGIVGAASAFNKVVSATAEAEKAVFQFDIAFKALGKNVGQTREQLLAFADETGARSIFDDESIIRAQAVLLRFRSVTGDAFVRARQVALDLASAMGTDLVSAANAVGRALERPTMALRMLRQYGIVFSRDQETLIRQLEKTGQSAKAAAIILEELEGRFKGATTAAGTSLSGVLARLRNAFDNMFEASDNGEKLTRSLAGLVDILNNPALKNSMSNIAAAGLDLVSVFGTIALGATRATDKITDFYSRTRALNPESVGKSSLESAFAIERTNLRRLEAEENRETILRQRRMRRGYRRAQLTPETEAADIERSRQIEVTRRLVAELQKQVDVERNLAQLTGVEVTSKRVGALAGTTAALGEALQEVVVSASKTVVSATQSLYDQWNEETKTSIEKQVAQYEELIAKINELAAAGRITQGDAAARTREVVEGALQEYEVQSQKVVPTAAIDSAREAFENFSTSISTSLANAITQGGLEGMTTLRDIVRNTLRGVLADILASGVKKGLMSLFEGLTGGSKGGGVVSGIASFFTNLFLPGKAGGGNVTGARPFMVGEEGPEMFWPNTSGRIMSAPALAGAGGGIVNYSPQTSITVNGNALDDKTKEELLAVIELGRARDQRQLSRIVTRNGLRGAR